MLFVWTLLLGLGFAPGSAFARFVELTFDDATDLAGADNGYAELDNLERVKGALDVAPPTAYLTGTARRSVYGDGRYGRAADFVGGQGSIEIRDWSGGGGGVITTYCWLRGRSVQTGRIVHVPDTFAVGFDAGELVISLPDGVGGDTVVRSGVLWPDDAAYHHLALTVDNSVSPPEVSFIVDFAPAVVVPIPSLSAPDAVSITLGEGFDGLLDELVISAGHPGEMELFDFSPTDCPGELLCDEETIATLPTDFPHTVPTRFKTAYDPALCSAAMPCPLLFDISGGSDCADDYQSPGSVHHFAALGFLVVTVDPYCEGDADTSHYPTETSQLIAVKDHLLTSSPVAPLIEGPEYAATGCSHGAGTVLVWAMHEVDHPARTYARSPSVDALCGYAAGVLCPAVAEAREAFILEQFGSADLDAPWAQAFHAQRASVDLITPAMAASREIAISWGVNLEGNVCSEDGGYNCTEEGLYGMNYGARRFRDVWQLLEPAGGPTGYFVEDRGADCRHCASSDSNAHRCGECLLRHGRAAMPVECPECLDYSAGDIGPGRDAERCPMETSWYTDPLPGAAAPRPPSQDTPGGCGCRAPGATPPSLLVLVLLLVGAWRRRHRTS